MKDVDVTLPSGSKITVPYGTRVDAILEDEEFNSIEGPFVGAFANNELTSLSFKIGINCSVRPIAVNTPTGNRIYRDSLCFLLTKTAKKLFPDKRLVISNSLGNSYYFYFIDMEEIPDKDISAIEKSMREDVEKDLPIMRQVISYQEAVDFFNKSNCKDTSLLLKHGNDSKIALYKCEDYRDLAHTPIAPRTGILKYFEIMKYSNGFLLIYPDSVNLQEIKPFRDIPLLSAIFQEYKAWGKIQKFSSVGELNEHIDAGNTEEIIRVADALHNKKIAQIADQIALKRGKVKLVLIAGPSSSGKTTFSKKLSTQLRVVGYNPIALSLDDYYVNRETTPKDEDGEYDFESIYAINLKLFNKNLLDFISGKEVEIPSFNFLTGKSEFKGRKIIMDNRSILVVEGIHGLNEKLTCDIDHDFKHKIYISALTQLNLDDHNRIPTTDNRLLRRMVRDFQFRGYSALDTLSRWPSVRKGEDRNIFPFQENADSVFNSALDYELAVLKSFADPILKTVKPYHELYSEAKRLQRFLENFTSIPARYVPRTSILREFIGDSGFKY
ncbi:MAG: nucleoside kinase [Spirochaetia bacterium]|jgi:uridine kinase|nr:nucleoside kinase [Spirochaetia bacterium]